SSFSTSLSVIASRLRKRKVSTPFWVMPENTPSQKRMCRCGFKFKAEPASWVKLMAPDFGSLIPAATALVL
ncbi:MAG: hypothetical protein WCI18_16970, partial [Pseudomonadota bacterium]